MSEIINDNNKKRVSYSQYSTYFRCPHQWELDYVQNLRIKDGNVNTAFGTAIHHAFQTYLNVLFNDGVEKAKKINMYKMFLDKFKEESNNITLENNKISEQDFKSFSKDGKNILRELSRDYVRIQHFPETEYNLIGVEIPLNIPLINNVDFVGYIDIVLKHKSENKYKIIDIKTSGVGWNKWIRADESKYVQLHLYKHVYSKKFNVPHDDIDIEFFIVKRRPYNYNQSRIQIFVPPHEKTDINKSLNNFITFLNEAFNPDGTYNTNYTYPKNPGKNNRNCKFCPHLGNLCDGK